MARNILTETVEFTKEFVSAGSFFLCVSFVAVILITQSFVFAYPAPKEPLTAKEYLREDFGMNCGADITKQYFVIGATHLSSVRMDKLVQWQNKLLLEKDDE